MRHRYMLILLIVTIDAMGIGIVFPTMPALLRSLLPGAGDTTITRQYGYLLAAYALTNLLSSPVLGVLSDRYGRRPVLLAGLFGTTFDNLVMALAPTLSFVYVGRTLAGVTGATLTVANAYVADITSEEKRSEAFGRVNACFGLGFIAGPILGGLAGSYSVRAPFYLAAALSCISALLCVPALPESRGQILAASRIRLQTLQPLAPLARIGGLPGIGPLLYIFGTLSIVNQVTGVLWVVYGTARFHWSALAVGVSLAFYGLLYAACQAFLTNLTEMRIGRRGTVLFGIAVDVLGFGLFAFARTTAAALCTIPLLALGGLALPPLQSILSGSVHRERQGELQGVLTSLNSVIAVLCPVAGSHLYAALQQEAPSFPGAVWLCALPLYLPCLFVLRRVKAG